jgi:RNA polymerase sigma-70 factor (ECF subfamily)
MTPENDPRFREFFSAEYYKLVASLTLVTGDRELATDAVAEAIARAWEHLRRGAEIESLAAWTRTVALNVARGTFRKRAVERRARHRLEVNDIEPDPAVSSDGAYVRQLLSLLPRRQREVVVLRYFLDLDTQEIGRELGIVPATVRILLRRARITLANVVDQRGGVQEFLESLE